MYGLDTIKRLNAQKTGDHTWTTHDAGYVIVEDGSGKRQTFLDVASIPTGSTVVERVGI